MRAGLGVEAVCTWSLQDRNLAGIPCPLSPRPGNSQFLPGGALPDGDGGLLAAQLVLSLPHLQKPSSIRGACSNLWMGKGRERMRYGAKAIQQSHLQ